MARARVLGQNGREKGRGGEKSFSFLFSNQIFNSFPNEFLNPTSFLQIHSSHK
jgi:hypothetical protein